MAGIFRVARERARRQDTYFYHVEDGWQYHISFRRNMTRYLKCVRKELHGCYGRAIMDPVDGFSHTNPHNGHEIDIHYPAEMELRHRILDRCRSLEYVSFAQILDQECLGYVQEVTSRVSLAGMRTCMRNARLENYPPIPHTMQNLTMILMNPEYSTITMTADGLGNLYAGSVTDVAGGHHIIFASERMLDLMKTFTVLHADGTFKVVPAGPGASQVLALVGVWNHHIMPLAWILMENRQEVAYVAVLTFLRNHLGADIELNKVITDFEPALQNAWHNVFNVRVQGCLWHLSRIFISYAEELQMMVFLRNMPEVKRIVRLCMALPLLPLNYIRRGLVVIASEARDEGRYVNDIVAPFLEKVYLNWVQSDRRLARMCVFQSSQRTNNACESHNRTLRRSLNVHPNIYVFINALVKLERETWDMKLALEGGYRYRRARRRTSIMNDQRIHNLSEEVLNHPPGARNRSVLRFLRAASLVMNGMLEEALH